MFAPQFSPIASEAAALIASKQMYLNQGIEMTRLPRILEQFSALIADGAIKSDTMRSQEGVDFHRVLFDEDQWPKARPVAFTPVAFKVKAVAGEAAEKTLLRAILAAPENVHKLTKIINSYQLPAGVNAHFREIKAIQEAHKNNLAMFDSITQKGAYTVEAFFVRPECPTKHPRLFKSIARPTQDAIDELAKDGMYKSVAIISVPPGIAEADVAEYALNAMHHGHLHKNHGILSGAVLPRPVTAGDVFIINERKAEVVLSSGFKRLERFWPSGAYEDAPRSNYTISSPSP